MIICHAVNDGELVFEPIVGTDVGKGEWVEHALGRRDDRIAEEVGAFLLEAADKIEDNVVGHTGIGLGGFGFVTLAEEVDKVLVIGV